MLYNSEFSFSERLYGPLDVDVCRIKLHEPLSIICKQPLLYVRDMVPKPCFQSLVKLEQVTLHLFSSLHRGSFWYLARVNINGVMLPIYEVRDMVETSILLGYHRCMSHVKHKHILSNSHTLYLTGVSAMTPAFPIYILLC